MERVLSRDAAGRVGERVTVAGWLHAIRRPGGIVFAVLRDRAGLIQVVSEDASHADLLQECGVESVLAVTGAVAAEPRARRGIEIRAERIEALSPPEGEPPLQINKHRLSAGLDA